MPLKPLDPVVKQELCPGWEIAALESGRSTDGLKANMMLTNGTPQHYRMLDLGDDDAQKTLATIWASKTGEDIDTVLKVLLRLILMIESATRLRDTKQSSVPKDQEYAQDGDGLWLVKHHAHGDERIHLANFGATITADIVEDDGTPDTKRFFELEAHHGSTYATVRVAAKDFHGMAWIAETLGAKARLYVQQYSKDHTAAAIQDLSDHIDTQHVFVHTGWRCLGGQWHYLHGSGAIHAEGASGDVLVHLSDTLARYELPVPPADKERCAALQASLALRDVAPNRAMIAILANTYLAPLRTLLRGEPPDLTTWILGPSGQFKSEYAALALSHYGDFTRLTLPATFIATGNGLERLCHTLQDCLLVVDDFHPAGNRKEVEAMNQTAGRLLRGIGNQTGRQRMRQDTSMRTELPPRCLVLATGERLPDGYSTNARLFLVTVPKLGDEAKRACAARVNTAQEHRPVLPHAMSAYLQWIAEHWDALSTEVPDRFHALRTAAYQAGSHAREPSQVAYLQLGWEMFTQCAVEAGALTQEERTALLGDTQAYLLRIASDHSQILETETTASRFCALLLDGFAAKAIYLRGLDDHPPSGYTQWGWTEDMEYDRTTTTNMPVAKAHQATLLGYIDTDYMYLLPEATYRYLQQASQKANRAWPVDSTTLLRELADAGYIRVDAKEGKPVHRTVNKKIHGVATRCIWLERKTFDLLRGECVEDSQAPTPGPGPKYQMSGREPGMEDPEPEMEDDEIPF